MMCQAREEWWGTRRHRGWWALLLLGGLAWPTWGATSEEIERWVRDLGDPQFDVRFEAKQKLLAVGQPAVPALKAAARGEGLRATWAYGILVDVRASDLPPRPKESSDMPTQTPTAPAASPADAAPSAPKTVTPPEATVRLKNGTEVRGRIVSLDATRIVVQTAYGTMTIPQGEVMEIRYGQVPVGKPDAMGASIAYLVQRKDPSTAFLYAWLISGGGHFYAGETETGGYLIIGELAGLVLALVGAGSGTDLLTISGVAGVLGARIYGLADAPAAVNRYNQRLEEKSGLRSGAGGPSLLRVAVRW